MAGIGGVGERQELALGREQVNALRFATQAPVCLLQNPGEVLALGVLQGAMNVLIDRRRDEAGAEQANDLVVLKSRRTVGDAIVSDTTQRMAAANQQINGLFVAHRLIAGFQERELPVDGFPRFPRRLKQLVQLFELGTENPARSSAAADPIEMPR